MKKQALILSAVLITSALQCGPSVSDVTSELTRAANQFGKDAFNKSASVSSINASFDVWNKAVANAKTFVMNNCKDLLGKQDPALVESMTNVEKVSKDFINAIHLVRNALPNAPISKFLGISSEAKKATAKLYTASFTLPSKKDASTVIKSIGRFLEDTPKSYYDMLLVKQ